MIGGDVIEAGFVDGEFISINESGDRVASVTGLGGQTVITRLDDQSGEIEITMLQTSDGNDILDEMAQLNRRGPGLPGVRTCFIRDRNGRALFECPHVWVKTLPKVTYARSAAGERKWTLGFASNQENRVQGTPAF
jgi:hypothetical protein